MKDLEAEWHKLIHTVENDRESQILNQSPENEASRKC